MNPKEWKVGEGCECSECKLSDSSFRIKKIPDNIRRIKKEELEFDEKTYLERGKFGQIHKANWLGTDVIVKVPRPDRMKYNEAKQKFLMMSEKELGVFLKCTDFPNVTQLLGVYTVDEEQIGTNLFGSVIEYLEGGSLDGWLQKGEGKKILSNEGRRNEFIRKLLLILLDAAKGIYQLHRLYLTTVVHKYIACRNIFLTDSMVPRGKIGYFGLSHDIVLPEGDKEYVNPDDPLPQLWLPKDWLDSRGNHRLSTDVDVYSFGVTIYEAFTGGYPPFRVPGSGDFCTWTEAARRMHGGERPLSSSLPLCPKSVWYLMEKCWNSKPKDRPAMWQVVNELEDILMIYNDMELDPSHRMLFGNKENINIAQKNGWTPLHSAVHEGNINTVVMLLKLNEIDVNAKTLREYRGVGIGTTPLMMVLKKHSGKSWASDVIQYLLEKNANPNDRYGETPLICNVTLNGYSQYLEMLIEHKANVNDMDLNNDAPVHMACMNDDNTKCLAILIKHKADINIPNKINGTAAYIASVFGRDKCLEILIENKADINVPAMNCITPAYVATQKCHVKCLELLINNNADVNTTDMHGWTPLHWALSKGEINIVKLLLKLNEIDVNAKTSEKYDLTKTGTTPMKMVLEKHSGNNWAVDVVQSLLEKNVNLNERCGKLGRTYLDLAKRSGNKQCYNLILKYIEKRFYDIFEQLDVLVLPIEIIVFKYLYGVK